MFSDAKTQANDYLTFLKDSPSAYHASFEAAQRLEKMGYTRLYEHEVWPKAKGRYFIVREGAVIAWNLPESMTADNFKFKIVGAHADSPTMKLKPRPGSSKSPDGWNQLEVEIYGGMLANSWLDRDLGLAGRVITEDGTEHLVKTGAVARVPQLAIHLDREVNSKGLKLDPQQHLHPIWGFGHDLDVYDYLAQQAGVDKILGADVVTYDTAAPALIGPYQDFVAGARQDNLSSVYAALTAFEAAGEDHISVFSTFDHEEIGSGSRSGARGTLLAEILKHCSYTLGADSPQHRAALGRSVCFSADAGHLIHPNYPERHDPHHHPIPGGGPLLKVNADKRYATEARGTAMWHQICERAGVSTQNFVSNNSMPCGSTIGPFTATKLGVLTVDIGVGLLSMHSARELSHIEDIYQMTLALMEFWK